MDSVNTHQAPLKSPLTVSLWITGKCNLACKYCYAEASNGGFMETGRLLSLIDELAELEIFDMTLAGGEPLLHPDIFDIIDHILLITFLVHNCSKGFALFLSNDG